jgi:diguanylate cyclase (GGDEF)-like protein
MLDLDYFKIINDSYGQVFGDECLKRIAETLLASIRRETDRFALYGDEYIVFYYMTQTSRTAKLLQSKPYRRLPISVFLSKALEFHLPARLVLQRFTLNSIETVEHY